MATTVNKSNLTESPSDLPTLSIVIPVCNESSNLSALIDRLHKVIKTTDIGKVELIFVNDGSTDSSLATLQDLQSRDPSIVIVDLSRNFGKELAMSAGLSTARGKAIVFMDADLQHPPELLSELIAKWKEGFEVVATTRAEYESEPFMRKVFSRLFYFLMRWFSDVEILAKSTDYRLIDRKVAEELLKVTEKQRIFRGLIDWVGFRKTHVSFKAEARHSGQASYGFGKLAALALNSFVGHSSLPLLAVAYAGLTVSFFSILLLVVMLCDRFLGQNFFAFSSLAMVVVSNMVLTGMLLSTLGVMSLYLRKIYSETQGRPLYVIREVLRRQ